MPTTLLFDLFTGTTGTPLASHTMDVGSGWTTSGTWTIQSNAAQNTGTDGDTVVYADAGQADVTYTCDYTRGGSAWNGGLAFNFQDTSNFWLFDINRVAAFGTNFNLILYEKNGGSYTQRAADASLADSASAMGLKVVTAGDAISCYVDNVLKLSYSVGSRPFKTATKFGFRRDSAGGVTPTWDNFLVTVAGGSTPVGADALHYYGEHVMRGGGF